MFTAFNKYHSDGGQSVYDDAELDKLIEEAEVATGDERIAKWQEVLARIEEIVAEVQMFHMVGYPGSVLTSTSPRTSRATASCRSRRSS